LYCCFFSCLLLAPFSICYPKPLHHTILLLLLFSTTSISASSSSPFLSCQYDLTHLKSIGFQGVPWITLVITPKGFRSLIQTHLSNIICKLLVWAEWYWHENNNTIYIPSMSDKVVTRSLVSRTVHSSPSNWMARCQVRTTVPFSSQVKLPSAKIPSPCAILAYPPVPNLIFWFSRVTSTVPVRVRMDLLLKTFLTWTVKTECHGGMFWETVFRDTRLGRGPVQGPPPTAVTWTAFGLPDASSTWRSNSTCHPWFLSGQEKKHKDSVLDCT